MCETITAPSNRIDVTMGSFLEIKNAVSQKGSYVDIAAQEAERRKKSHNPDNCKIKGTAKCQKTCGTDIASSLPAHLMAIKTSQVISKVIN